MRRCGTVAESRQQRALAVAGESRVGARTCCVLRIALHQHHEVGAVHRLFAVGDAGESLDVREAHQNRPGAVKGL